MKCYTLNNCGLSRGIVLEEGWKLRLGACGNNAHGESVVIHRNRPPCFSNFPKPTRVLDALLYTIAPPRPDGLRPRPFWVFGRPDRSSPRLLVFIDGAFELVRGTTKDFVVGWTPTKKQRLVEFLDGVIRVKLDGKDSYVVYEDRQRVPKLMTAKAFAAYEAKLLAAEQATEEAERRRLEEETHWSSKKTDLVTVNVGVRTFRHHSGVSLYEGHYRATDTYIEVVVPGDKEKPARTISVDEAIRAQTGWKVITRKRLDALTRTCPAQITLVGKREFEERDTGERRNVTTWYEPDPTELKAWIDRALALL